MKILSSYHIIRQTLSEKWNTLFGFLSRLWKSESKISILILAGITFSLALVYFVSRVGSPFYHDSLYYWDLANQFADERFSFTNFSDGLRGYFFPFLLFLLKKQAALLGIDGQLLFQVYTALFFTVLSIYILPWSFRVFFRWRTHLWGRALIAILLFFFWRGYFRYPLSDFPAFALFLVGVTLLLSSMEARKFPFWIVVAGACIGAAINTRPVFQIALIFIIPIVFIYFFKKGIAKGAAWFSVILLGFGLIVFPQFQINSTHFNVKSPWVLARVVGDENLFVKQLFWGLETQRYESSIGDNYPSIVVGYSDPFINNLQKTNLLREKTIARYIKIMKRFPLEIAISYFRHLFNGLDPYYATPYISNIFVNHVFLSTVNYLIWFLVLFKLVKINLSQLKYANVFGLMGLLAPVALAIPTAVEVRFFLPAYLLAYGVIAFGLDYITILRSHLNNGWKVLRFILLGTFWILMCFTLSNTTMGHLVR